MQSGLAADLWSRTMEMRKSGILMPWTRASEALLPLTFWDRQFFVVWAFYGFYTIAALSVGGTSFP